jgi:hypothetical protein
MTPPRRDEPLAVLPDDVRDIVSTAFETHGRELVDKILTEKGYKGTEELRKLIGLVVADSKVALGETCGRAERIEERIKTMENIQSVHGQAIGTIREEHAEARGAAKQQTRNLAIIVATFGVVNVLVAVVGLLLKLRGHG